MKLETLVLPEEELGAYLERDNWIEEMRKDFQVVCFKLSDIGNPAEKDFKRRLNVFLSSRQVNKEKALFLAQSLDMLRLAKQLHYPALPCDLRTEGIYEQYDETEYKIIVEKFWEADAEFFEHCYLRAKGLPWVIFETEDLIVREQTVEDVKALYEIYQADSIKQFLDPLYSTLEEEEAYTKKYIAYVYEYYGYGLWYIEDKRNGKCVGRAGISPRIFEDGVSGIELGYVIAQEYQNKGICTDVCRRILDYAKEKHDIHKVYCLIREDNIPSIRVAEKLGFCQEKRLETHEGHMIRFMLVQN